ncbi:MAG: excinuclease ABC subunit UvrC [Candidatus Saccharimonadales bacterium]
MNKQLEAKLKKLPSSPGVYFHKSANGEVIYVGKAAILKNRVRQYFQSQRDMDIKTRALVAEIEDTEWIETESEIDALFLESEMIKRYMPRFNILLRDDKSQMYIRIDMKSDWPSVTFTRNPADDGADYFGPYYNGFAIKKALRYLRRIFPYFTKPLKSVDRPDLDSHIGLSTAPGTMSEEYKTSLKKLIKYFEGGRKTIARELEKDMHDFAKRQDFEEAARLRNRLKDLSELQRKIMFGDREFLDISKDKALSDLVTLFGLSKIPARIEGYDISHMGGVNVVASMVVFTNGVSNRSEYRKFKTKIEQNNDTANMHETLLRRFSEKNIKSWGMPDLVLIDGGKGQLDASMKALEERNINVPIISIAKREEEIIVHSSRSNIDTSMLESLIKNPTENEYVERSGEYYVVNLHPGQRNAGSHSKNLRGGSFTNTHTDVVKLFQRIRDESHRFAVSYHTVLKRQKQTASDLEAIPGIGPATRKKLIRTFGSLRAVKSANEQQLIEVVGKVKADKIKPFLT